LQVDQALDQRQVLGDCRAAAPVGRVHRRAGAALLPALPLAPQVSPHFLEHATSL
jgi:hypothetical protein